MSACNLQKGEYSRKKTHTTNKQQQQTNQQQKNQLQQQKLGNQMWNDGCCAWFRLVCCNSSSYVGVSSSTEQ